MPIKILNINLGYSIKWSILDRIFNQFFYFLLILFISRIIGPESFGVVGLLLAIVVILETTISNGFSQALIQRSSQLTEEDSSTVFYINLIWSIFIYILLYLIAPFIAIYYDNLDLTPMARVLFLIILFNSLVVVSRAKLSVDFKFKEIAIAGMVSIFISAIFTMFSILNEMGYWSLVILYVSRSFFQSCIFFYLCKWRPKFIFNFNSFSNLFGFGSKLMLAGFIANIVNNIYVFVIGRNFSIEQVGYFTQGNNLSNFLSDFITGIVRNISYPLMTAIKENTDKLKYAYKKTISYTLLISLPVLIGFSCVSYEFVLVFLGKDWVFMVPILNVLCFARAIIPVSAINMNMLNVVGKPELFLKVDLIKTPLTITGLFISIPYGVEAVAWAILINTVIAFFINSYYIGVFFNIGGLSQIKIAKNYIISTIIMVLSISFISSDNLIFSMLFKILLGAVVYICSLFLLRDKNFMEIFSKK